MHCLGRTLQVKNKSACFEFIHRINRIVILSLSYLSYPSVIVIYDLLNFAHRVEEINVLPFS